MDTKTFEPSEDLKKYVWCYWNLESKKELTPLKNTIIPDGTLKLIFHYKDSYTHHPKNNFSFILPRCFLIGQLTQPFVVEPNGETGTFIVRFHPNGTQPFISVDLKHFENKAIKLDVLFGKEGIDLEEAILGSANTQERISIIENFLLQKLNLKNSVDIIVQNTVATILEMKGRFSINDFSIENQVHRRQLCRKFLKTIGLSPKQLAKTIRLQSTLQFLLNEGKKTTLTHLAYENDYYDQAHFIKEFKEFTGLTPKEFFGDDLRMSLIFDKNS